MKIKPLFAWYDLWVGAYWDNKARRLYILPLPMLGVVIDLWDLFNPPRWIHTPNKDSYFYVRGHGDEMLLLHHGVTGDKKWHSVPDSMESLAWDSEKKKLQEAIGCESQPV